MRPSFNAISRRYTQELLVHEKKSKFCKQCVRLNYSRYSHESLLTLCDHWQTISILFLLEMVIAKDY